MRTATYCPLVVLLLIADVLVCWQEEAKMLKPVTAFILHVVPTGTICRRSACTCVSVISSSEEGSVMTMESLRDILHRRQADLLDEINADDATEDSSHDDTSS